MHQAVLEARLLTLGTNLKRTFVAAMLEWIDSGWELGEFSSVGGTFFCSRIGERRMVAITPSDPQCRAPALPQIWGRIGADGRQNRICHHQTPGRESE
jgi:hypothetical protein